MRDEQCKAWHFPHGETPRRCHLGPTHAGFHESGSFIWSEVVATYPVDGLPCEGCDHLSHGDGICGSCMCGHEVPEPKVDQVNHPDHYTWMKNGVEVIDITSQFSFTLGNALKYIMRAGHKGNALADLKKARWYIDYEIKRIEGGE